MAENDRDSMVDLREHEVLLGHATDGQNDEHNFHSCSYGDGEVGGEALIILTPDGEAEDEYQEQETEQVEMQQLCHYHRYCVANTCPVNVHDCYFHYFVFG